MNPAPIRPVTTSGIEPESDNGHQKRVAKVFDRGAHLSESISAIAGGCPVLCRLFRPLGCLNVQGSWFKASRWRLLTL
jgi:hypothetical protein